MLAATDTCPLEVSDGDEGICTYADAVVPDNAKESSIDSTAPILQVSNPEHMQPVRSVNREDGHDANALPETPIFRSLLKHSEATGSCVVTDVEPGDVEQNLSGLREVPEQIASSGRSSISSVSTEIYIGTASMFSEAEAEAASFSTLQVDDCLHADDSTFMEVNLHRQNSWDWTSSRVDMKMVFDKCKKGSTKPPITGISGLLSRSLLIGKTRDPLIAANESEPGWKLFGRVPPRGLPNRDPKAILKMWQMFHRLELCPPEPDSMDNRLKYNTMIGRSQEYEERTGRTLQSNGSQLQLKKQQQWTAPRKPLSFEPLSTTALILENRPPNLPAKCVQEAQKHRQEYEEMVAQARKREVKEAEKRKKKMKERCKIEDGISTAVMTWNAEILPNWETLKQTRWVRDLWWQGIPPSVRDKVWSLAIGNDLNITHELYEIFLSRAMEKWKQFEDLNMENGDVEAELELELEAVGADRENSLELIKLDISRTFPTLCIFQKGGPYHNVLQNILGAYTCYRPDVGYVQGMSFIAAVLLLNLNAADAFVVFANLLNKPCQLAFFRVDHGLMLKYYAAFEVFFEENLPNLFAHFKKYNLTPDIYLIDWIFTLYSKSLPLDVACRVWDVFCRDGEEFLFRTAIAILLMFEAVLLRMDFIHMAQMLTRLPENLSIDELFTSIATVQLQSRNKKWGQVLATLQRDWRESGESSRNSSPNRQ